MVKQITKENVYECEDCNLKYRDMSWATKCEEWCKKHKTCNIEITKHSTIKE